ncbi:MAG: replication-relaxation family protein [Verrucomicrobiota bacterium]
MEKRLPRFVRATVAQMQLTDRDRTIIRLVHRHRFLSSRQIIALVGDSQLQVLRRLKLLYHHGFLERPRAQLQYYDTPGTRPIVYGLSTKGRIMLKQELGDSSLWSEKNHAIGQVFLEHALLVSETMVSIELACQKHGIRLLYEDELDLPVQKQPFQWRVKIQGSMNLGVIPDRVFAIEYQNQAGQVERAYFFLEADRGTMPVVRKQLTQTSFRRKLLAYEATWINKVHQRHLGIHHFRALTVTTIVARVQSLLLACSQLKRGHGLFLFADTSALEKDIFSPVWRNGKTGKLSPLLDLPIRQVPASPDFSANP